MTVVDSLVFLGPSYTGADLNADDLFRRMDVLGIEVAVVCPARPPDYHLPPANDRVLEIAGRHPDRLVPLCRVDPNRADAGAEVERCFAAGARGLFLHPFEENFRVDDRRAGALVATAGTHRRPVLIAAGYPWVSEPMQVGELATAFPGTRVVMTNCGQFNISGLGMTQAALVLQRHANLLTLTTGEYRQDFIESVAANLGGDRILFASAAPTFDQGFELARARSAHLPDAVKRLILGDAAIALFAVAR